MLGIGNSPSNFSFYFGNVLELELVKDGLVGNIDFSAVDNMTFSGNEILTITDTINGITGTTFSSTNRPIYDPNYFKGSVGAAVFDGASGANAIDFGNPDEWNIGPDEEISIYSVSYCPPDTTGMIVSKATGTRHFTQYYDTASSLNFIGSHVGGQRAQITSEAATGRGTIFGTRSTGSSHQIEIKTGVIGTSSSGSSAVPNAKWLVGSRWDTENTTLTYPMNGGIGQVLIYNRRLTDEEHAQVVNFLRNKWVVDKRFIVIGASIMNDLPQVSTQRIINAQYKTDFEVIMRGINGNAISNLAARINTEVANHAEEGAYWLCHIGGNNVTSTRPFTSVNQTTKDAWLADYQDIIDAVTASGGIFIPSSLTFRNYDGTTVDNQEAGSLPYNRELFLPFLKTNAPDWFFPDTEQPFVQFYEVILNNFNTFLTGDNVHPTEEGILGMQEHIRDTVIKKIVTGVAPDILDINIPVIDPVLANSNGLVAYYNYTKSDIVTAGSSVMSVTDLSANAFTKVSPETTVNKPTLVTVDGVEALRYASSNSQRMQTTANAAAVLTTTPVTIITALIPQNTNWFFGVQGSGPSGTRMRVRQNGTDLGNSLTSITASTGNKQIISAWVTQSGDTKTQFIQRNLGTPNSGVTNRTGGPTNPFFFGFNGYTSDGYYNGDVFAQVIYDRALSQEEREEIINFFAAQIGLSL